MLNQKEENCFEFWLVGYNYKHKIKLIIFMAMKLKWRALFPADNISVAAHLFTPGRLPELTHPYLAPSCPSPVHFLSSLGVN